jgi:type I restriction enzyme S subunit
LSWPLVKLAEVAPAKPLKQVSQSPENIVLQITLDNIESGTGRLVKRNYQPAAKAGNSKYWFDENHVLYSKLRPYLNKVYLPTEIGIATTELVPLSPIKHVLDRTYLAHYLRSKSFVDWVSSQTAGAKMPRVSMAVFWEHKIPLPPLAEQKRIAGILDKADGIRRKRQQAIDLADEFLRATFLDVFGDPVTNPKRWKVSPLIKCAELINGDRSSNYPSGGDLVDSGVLFLNTKNITKGRLDYDKSTFITQEKFDSLGGGKLVRDDLVITMRGTLGSCALFDGPFETGFINAQLMIIRCNNSLKPLFLHSLLTSEVIHRKFQEMSRGAAVPQLTGAQMKELAVICPPEELQDKFLGIREKTFSTLGKMNEVCCADLFESLSQKAFAGQLSV